MARAKYSTYCTHSTASITNLQSVYADLVDFGISAGLGEGGVNTGSVLIQSASYAGHRVDTG